MSEDRREQAIARLVEIAKTLEGVTVTRNRDIETETNLPSVDIFDADETFDLQLDRGGHAGLAPILLDLTPEIYLKVAGKPDEIGPAVNALRVKFLKAVVNDATLLGILSSNGRVRNHGCSTSLGKGRTMQAEMRVHLVLTYPFIPNEL